MHDLNLDLSDHDLGANVKIIKYLGNCMKYLPSKLQQLSLDFISTNLGGNVDNIKCLVNGMK